MLKSLASRHAAAMAADLPASAAILPLAASHHQVNPCESIVALLKGATMPRSYMQVCSDKSQSDSQTQASQSLSQSLSCSSVLPIERNAETPQPEALYQNQTD